MTDEPEYVSTHDRVSENAAKEFAQTLGLKPPTAIKTHEQDKMTELEDVRRALKYVLDKLSSMDRFLRSSQYRYNGRVMDGEAYEKEVIEKFLITSRDGKLSEEHKQLCNKILLGFTPKQIDKDE